MKRMALSSLLMAAVSVISKQIAPASRRRLFELLDDEGEEASSASDCPERLIAKSTGRDHSRCCASARAAKAVLDHPAVERADQVVALGRGDEGGGLDDLAVFVEHADEDLAEQVPGRFLRDRLDELVEEAEAVVLEGAVDAVDPLHLAVALGDQGVVQLVSWTRLRPLSFAT